MKPDTQDALASTSVTEIIEAQRITKFQLLVFALCCLVSLVDGLDQFIVIYMAGPMLVDLGSPPSSLGPLVSASTVGLMLFALVGGILGDRVGRRNGVLGCVVAFGILTLLKGAAPSYSVLLVLQFLAGCALGGALPGVFALAAEYAPARRKVLIVSIISGSYSLGGAIGGSLVAALLEDIGWRHLFHLSGAITLIVAFCCLMWLPESAHFLILKGAARERIERIMRKLAPGKSWEEIRWAAPDVRQQSRSSVADVFRDGRAVFTFLICLALGANLLSAYFVLSFTPMLLGMAGMSLNQSAMAGIVLLVGGPIGTLLWGWLVDRYWPPLVFAASAAMTALCLAFVGPALGNYLLLMLLLSISGIGKGAVNAYNGFIAAIYPTQIRGTASGLTLTVGRIGSVCGPLLGGILMARGWGISELYYVPAGVTAVAFAATLLMGLHPASRTFIERTHGKRTRNAGQT